MELMANRFAAGAAKEKDVAIVLKKAVDANADDLLNCKGIAIGSPEYFGTMAGMIKDFFDRTFEVAQDRTIGLPFVVFVCAGNDGRGAITQIERIAAGYKWKKSAGTHESRGSPDRAGFSWPGRTGTDFGRRD
jgi:multimeric flavodoxin WrbA